MAGTAVCREAAAEQNPAYRGAVFFFLLSLNTRESLVNQSFIL